MKKILAFLLAVTMATLLCACGGDSIVGKWEFGGNSYEFKDDNSVSISINGALNYEGTYEIDGDTVTLDVSGLVGEKTVDLTYSVDGDTLSLTGDVTLTGAAETTIDFAKAE